ncbi:MAG: phospholipid carrier-dependent glycosyltransferase [Planctomycetes bacterium]|nr:phospholipid carrier-dependent glycosyltransferase [Planctomycetota bacterium]
MRLLGEFRVAAIPAKLHGKPTADAACVGCFSARAALAALLLAHAGLLAHGATQHSPTMLEPAFLVSGISHWQFGRFELFRVNPPLVRMVAALPVLAAGCETDWSRYYDGPGSRAEFPLGSDFVKVNGERSIWLFTVARWACIPFSVLGGLFCFLWARELWGSEWSGLIAAALWCFEPNVLAHGELITADCAAASFGLGAGYFFWRWLRRPGWDRAFLAGLFLGLAELTKTTWIILFGLWPLLWVVFGRGLRVEGRASKSRRRGEPRGAPLMQLAFLLLFAVYLINVAYGFDGTLTRLEDFTFVSRTLTGAKETGKPGNRFANTWLGELPVPLPKQYVLGIDTQKSDFERPHRSYLAGEWKEGGWWYYYLYGLWVKVPHGTQLVVVLALVVFVWRWAWGRRVQREGARAGSLNREAVFADGGRPVVETGLPAPANGGREPTGEEEPDGDASGSPTSGPHGDESVSSLEGGSGPRLSALSSPLSSSLNPQPSPLNVLVLLLPALCVFVLVSSQTNLNEHFRYVLPCFGFVFVFCGALGRRVAGGEEPRGQRNKTKRR